MAIIFCNYINNLPLLKPNNMNKMLHKISSSGFRNVRTVLLLTMLLFAGTAQAAHFRSGTISWRPISGNTVEFKVSQSYGGWAFGSGYTLGSTQIMDYLYTGNGYASVPIPLVITSINAAEGWWYGEATFNILILLQVIMLHIFLVVVELVIFLIIVINNGEMKQ
jgi:hypothetical protein